MFGWHDNVFSFVIIYEISAERRKIHVRMVDTDEMLTAHLPIMEEEWMIKYHTKKT